MPLVKGKIPRRKDYQQSCLLAGGGKATYGGVMTYEFSRRRAAHEDTNDV
jgi:hypothetical protein